MAPRKADVGADAKRQATSVLAATAKKQRIEVSTEKLNDKRIQDVEQALELVEDISGTGREMLRLMVPGCLGVNPQERHQYQHASAKMLEEVFQTIEDGLSQRMSSVKVQAELALAGRDSQVEDLRKMKQAFLSRVEDFDAAKAAWLTANRSLQSARRSVEKAIEARRECEVKLKEASGNRDELKLAVETQMPAIIAGDKACMDVHLQPLQELLAKLPLEDSLRNAANASLRLQPEARGFFDKTVLQQLLEALAKLLEAAPLAEAETLAVEEAKESEAKMVPLFDEARAKQASAAAALLEAELDVRAAEGAEGVAVETLQTSEEALLRAESSLQESEKGLQAFQNGPFRSLQDLISPPEADTTPSEPQKEKEGDSLKDGTCKEVPTPLRAVSA
eukprot:TRINITY_DN81404_c0_g1_i1.p1 TRINITY_DN81404_c0_g1~~TRINITY_DN81404_c0_g1_i1.p1  ORF type:complete len:413 (+),score=133.89 TRINITY_DN81404_c0_g1_i1:61-1239(+)